jgi:hypothetical protein
VLQPQFFKVNDALTKVERSFLLPKGLPGRPWFKHAIYAPGLTTGYASWTLPGLRQGIIDNDAEMIAAQLPALAERIDAATASLKLAFDATTNGNVPIANPQPPAVPQPTTPTPAGAGTVPPANGAPKPANGLGGKG